MYMYKHHAHEHASEDNPLNILLVQTEVTTEKTDLAGIENHHSRKNF